MNEKVYPIILVFCFFNEPETMDFFDMISRIYGVDYALRHMALK
jgi:hypothetical protein